MKARWLSGIGAIAAAALVSTGLLARPVPDSYIERRLASDVPVLTPNTDPELVNPWGIAAGPDGIWMVSNANAVAKLYTSSGQVALLPGRGQSIALPAYPTGIAVNTTTGFVVRSHTGADVARLVFASERGTISAWSPNVAPREAIVTVDATGHAAHYTGVAIYPRRGGSFLYAADFHNALVDVYDERWAHLGAFTDPTLPAGYAPFNVAVLGERVFVAFAEKDPDGEGPLTGPGTGIVEEFHPNGTLLRVAASGQAVDTPWALVLAPAGFGTFAGALLVGNAGDGTIAAFDDATAAHIGRVSTRPGSPVEVHVLWGLGFAPAGPGGLPVLYYGAGIHEGAHGLLGSVRLQR